MTNVSVRYVMRTVGALLLGVAIATAPALTWAQHSGGGGGGGGGHASGGGGGHFGGGGHAFGGGGHFAGGFGGHYSFAAPHYGVSGHSYGGRYFAPTGHGFTYAGAHYAAHSGYVARGAAVAPHPPGAPGGPGYYHPWVGGYWHGVYWPHAWYYPGWAWYLPVLPLGYATFWWGGVPYYYWNSLYYTWNPADNGYVVTDPPPAAGTEGSADASGAYEQAPQANYGGGGSAADVYVYARNGQTAEQTQNDRYECHAWAVNQSGFDPTRQDQSGNPADYKRAMVACLDARGYSAR